MNNTEIAKKVIEAIGGNENVSSVAHCATRLRVMVKDESKINKDVVENLDKVQGAFFNSGQYQIIFGTGTVNKIYDEVVALGLPTSSTSDQKAEAAKQGNWFQRAIRSFGDVFVPILPAIVATGLFLGIRGAINNDTILSLFGTSAKAFGETDFYKYSAILTETAFAFFPALISWSAFRVFGGNPVLGIVLGLMMVSPNLPNAWDVASDPSKAATFFGVFHHVVGFQNSVLPAFFVGLLGAKLEKWLHKKIPDVLDLLLVPLFTLSIMSFLAIFIIGPFFHSVEEYVLQGTKAVLGLPFGLAGLVIGGVHQLIVVTGVHHIFNLLESQLIAADGKDPFNAIITAAMTAQAGATLAVGVKTKSKKVKALAFPATISALLGITEPAIFGINLRYVKPFVLALGAGAVGGWLASILNLAGTGFGITIIPGTLLYLNGQLLQYLFMVVFVMGLSFALTYAFGYKDEEPVAETTSEIEKTPVAENSVTLSDETLVSPIVGEAVAITSVNDPVFSSEAMGRGIAIKPSEGTVYAPADGVVTVAYDTGHAYGLKTVNGAEILIHVGIDTVSLDGNGFVKNVAQGDTVKAGDVLGTFDSAKIAEANLDDTTMVIVTNTNDYSSVVPVANGAVSQQDAIIKVTVD
ncbi:MAG: sucrose-specific PTS transporter subunit IIBC [Streptococcus sp.]|nr:sucrose-specific PTS transporter subunit IIBC [Streptococcus sp.]